MKSYLAVGNWKANPKSQREVSAYFSYFSGKRFSKHPPFIIATPFPFLSLAKAKAPKFCKIAGQTISAKEEGAHTGGVTVAMLKSVGVTHVILGHSELRKEGETDEAVATKTLLTVNASLTAIICVGEQERKSDGSHFTFIENQLRAALSEIDRTKTSKVVIAYEPLWAVNGDKSATDVETYEVIVRLRRLLVDMYGMDNAKKVKILYGGTVTNENARSFVESGGADGILVGRASWKPESFSKLIHSLYGANR